MKTSLKALTILTLSSATLFATEKSEAQILHEEITRHEVILDALKHKLNSLEGSETVAQKAEIKFIGSEIKYNSRPCGQID
ncbi:hypothetical protein ACFPK9_15790 [Rubritalea spongiae]|uniref:Uncharacterized protein n=1 Tax=Rubritalea spongiae TaxID=430797 RepID=A0ABW5DWY6_9BACT